MGSDIIVVNIRRKLGFSVMEILIVIILLSVRVVFALPNMRNSQDNARQRNALNQRPIDNTLEMGEQKRANDKEEVRCKRLIEEALIKLNGLNPVSVDNTEEVARFNQDIAVLQEQKETARNAETEEGDAEEGRCKGLIRALKTKRNALNPIPIDNTLEITKLKQDIAALKKQQETARYERWKC